MKILTIAVPSYNVEQYLDKALCAYADDRLKDGLEVLVVDDGSTDRTAEIAQSYVEKYPEIFRLIRKENGGHGSAVNAGMDHATGKYFRIVDGDDWVNTDNLVKLLALLQDSEADIVVDEKREVHMVTGDTQFFPLPDSVGRNWMYEFTDICENTQVIDCMMMHTMNTKTALLRENNIHLLEHIFYVDYEYIVKATTAAKTVTFVDLEIYQYLVGNVNQSVSYQNWVKRYAHHDKVTREMCDFADAYQGDARIAAYLTRRVCLIIHTHMNISLIFNENRKEGLRQAKEFRAYLKEKHPRFFALTAKRYRTARLLHMLGVDHARLQKLKK